MKYQHIFFDLDNTLWDFDANSTETIHELHANHKLDVLGISDIDHFVHEYRIINDEMWAKYRNGLIDRDTLRSTRFLFALQKFGVDDKKLARKMGDDYVRISPYKTKLVPNSIELLDYLANQYRLHIITNGFAEIQDVKLSKTGLEKYFDVIVTSDKAGVKKPHPRIFKFALDKSKAKGEHSLMIGDHMEADILGAKSAGMDQVFFNPNKVEHQEDITFEISNLNELHKIL